MAMEDHHVSALPVLDDQDRPVGVISRTDLLRRGKVEGSPGQPRPTLQFLTGLRVADAMTGRLVTVAPSTSVAEAARHMVDGHVHRVFVEAHGRIGAVFSTRDVMQAIVDKRLATPIGSYMTRPVKTIEARTPLARATQALRQEGVTGLVVVEDGFPIGVFTQRDALLARHHAAETPVEHAIDYSVVHLPPSTPVHRAAAQAITTHVRHVVVLDDGVLAGILTGIDLAGAAVLA
jgi:signal-transduction protein with cAMP-binding, CBS, and nucleotidyltransferase domain